MVRDIESVLAGRQVEAVRASGLLRLVLSGGVVLTVANDFRVRTAAEVEHFYPGLSAPASGLLAALVGSRVTGAAVTRAGGLELGFEPGVTLSVPPDTAVAGDAAWRVSGPDGPLFTAEPGGYLTV
ncbi:DUF6188 family protein [Kitasatospora sp. DSM 101779]|jgi:hypothetical protein|uniref:DUF6188 family protein n=1 Tax=Kitasatospora sp. DSM 101779 TaxID=2853165 RepID=UPI0021D7F087|nr:DUF6188 family protein [Kitasatospora sp. DSM 101779]MCU7825887.1 hypothetical protein [Kitasatospora sp. DSM 101779]